MLQATLAQPRISTQESNSKTSGDNPTLSNTAKHPNRRLSRSTQATTSGHPWLGFQTVNIRRSISREQEAGERTPRLLNSPNTLNIQITLLPKHHILSPAIATSLNSRPRRMLRRHQTLSAPLRQRIPMLHSTSTTNQQLKLNSNSLLPSPILRVRLILISSNPTSRLYHKHPLPSQPSLLNLPSPFSATRPSPHSHIGSMLLPSKPLFLQCGRRNPVPRMPLTRKRLSHPRHIMPPSNQW